MIELTERYVFHIPRCKYTDGGLEILEIDDILNDLFMGLSQNGFDGFYTVDAKSFYKSRGPYDELLIVLYSTSDKSPVGIFKQWFLKNNDFLAQDAYSYEHNGKMFVVNM